MRTTFNTPQVAFSQLTRGEKFIGNPHGGWVFMKTTIPGIAIRLADGGDVRWADDAMVWRSDLLGKPD